MVTEPAKYLIDSDILISMLRDTGDRTGLRAKALEVGLQNCYVSAISLAELSSGAFRMASDRGMFEVEFIKKIFNILPFGGNGGSGIFRQKQSDAGRCRISDSRYGSSDRIISTGRRVYNGNPQHSPFLAHPGIDDRGLVKEL